MFCLCHFASVKKGKIMRTKPVLWLILVLLTVSIACTVTRGNDTAETVRGSGNVITEEREVSDFTSIALQGWGKLVIDQTGSESFSITADDNFLPYIETEVRDRELIISIPSNTMFTDITDLTYQVTVKSLDGLELTGAGDIEILHLDAEDWQVNLSGAGNITVSGEVDTQTIVISGAGGYNAEDLSSQQASIEHSGAGMAVVQVSDTLDVNISGVGSVEYIGDPTVNQTITGLGSIHQR
jgi:hypothetical protein